MRRKRSSTTFNLSFLDVMSCGFGAVVLIFLIIDHASESGMDGSTSADRAEARLLKQEITVEKAHLVDTNNAVDLVDHRIVEMQGAAKQLLEQVRKIKEELAADDKDALSKLTHVNQLKADIKSLETDVKRLRAAKEEGKGDRARAVHGQAERQYLTGLRLGGKRILILLDSSASMLDRTLVNIIRLRNMPESTRRQTDKWQRAVKTVDWLSAQLPQDAEYQIYTFNTQAWPLLKGSEGDWLEVSDSGQLDKVMTNLRKLVPQDGTSLENAFADIADFVQLPDNILLITDGLPTQGAGPSKGTVSGLERLKLFNKALKKLPRNIPVNVILAPMEGDPMAAAAFWQLSVATRGSFMSPAKDWP